MSMRIISNPEIHRCDLPPLDVGLVGGLPRLDRNLKSVRLEIGAVIGCDHCDATYELTLTSDPYKAGELSWRRRVD